MSLILRFGEGKVDLITTSEAIMAVEARIDDWKKESYWIVDRVAGRIGVPFLGLFCTREAFAELVSGNNAVERLKALRAEGNVVLAHCLWIL